MAPNITSAPTGVLFEGESLDESTSIPAAKEKPKYVRQIVWRNVAIFTFLHIAALWGLYRIFTSAKLVTTIFGK